MLEFERGLDCLLIVFCIPDLLDDFQKHLHFFVADTVNTQLGGQSVKRDSHFKDGSDFFVPILNYFYKSIFPPAPFQFKIFSIFA